METITVKLFGHGQGFDPCPGARKWLKASVQLLDIKLPASGKLIRSLRAQCPTCGKWVNFDTKGKIQ